MPDAAVIQPLNRRQLYDLVWAEPMRDIAKRFGISDVGLAKLCRRFEIPTPKAAYWMKAQHGKKVRQTPLPAWTNRNGCHHYVSRRGDPRLIARITDPPAKPTDVRSADRGKVVP